MKSSKIVLLVFIAVFVVMLGTVIVSFASILGATLAFLAARFLFRNWVKPLKKLPWEYKHENL
jgi:uncharacterized membrane protein YdjX (TVP38/TMEM64 family)